MAQHKNSTCGQYQTTWKKFLEFLALRKIEQSSITSATAFAFLGYYAKTHNRGFSTIGTYKAALFHPLYFRLNVYIGKDNDSPEAASFMSGVFRRNPPNKVGIMPIWDLSDLLSFLIRGPFEPMNEVPFKLVVQKTLALILLATGRRISEIAALSRKSSRSGDAVSLSWLPDFTAKYHSADFRPDPPRISKSTDAQERLLCPVRAWEHYIKRRAVIANSANPLRFWPMSGKALTLEFKKLIKDSRKFVGKSDKVACGPHQMKKLACSYSKKYFPRSSKLLFKRVGSKSMNVLNRCYIKEVPALRFSCVLPLGTVRPRRE